MNCSVPECGNASLAKGLCTKHYYRVKRGGTAETTLRQSKKTLKCSVDCCDGEHHARQLCEKHYMKRFRDNDPLAKEKYNAHNRKWRANNPERFAQHQALYRERHREDLAEYHANWRKENWPDLKAYLAARKKRVKRQMPKWVNVVEIRAIYRNCPKGHHVDHIVPINGKTVSGLHVPWNLQYLPALENLRKSNKLL